MIQKGEVNSKIFYVEEGSLRAFLLQEEEEQSIRFAYKNNIITALDCYLSNQPTSIYIQAIRKTKLKYISKKKFQAFLEKDVDSLKNWQKILEILIYQYIEREQDLLYQSPQKRYERVLVRSPQLFQEIPHKHIASYLRMTPETLSRLKKK